MPVRSDWDERLARLRLRRAMRAAICAAGSRAGHRLGYIGTNVLHELDP